MDDLSDDSVGRPEAERVFEEYLGRLERGEAVDFEALCREHAAIAGTLRHMNQLLGAVGGAAEPTANAPTRTRAAPSSTIPITRAAGSILFQSNLPPQKSGQTSPGQVEPGDWVGDFELVQCIGRGGMGEVWEATQAALNRRVALKLLIADRVDPRVLEYFAREARAGGRLSHPGIVAVYGNGTSNGLHWIAMELVPGACDVRRSLDALIRETELPNNYYAYVAEFIAGAAQALQAAHEAGVIHRDLKPGNIIVTPDDQPKVSDFGLAKLIDERSLSVMGDLAGTYFYMSPEQVAAKRAGLDSRTDIFSLGVVLYEMLALVRPFDGDTPEQVTRKIMWEDPPNPQKIRSRIPRELVLICGKAMEKDRLRRYQSMADLAADLRRHLDGNPVWARPVGPVVRSAKWARRNPTKSVAMFVAAVALFIISAIAWELQISKRRAEEAQAQAELVADFQGRILRGLDSFAIGQVMVEEFEERLAGQFPEGVAGIAGEGDLAARFRALALRAPPVDVAKDLIDEVILAPAAAEVEREFGSDPAVEATLREALAHVYEDLAMLQPAFAQQERVVALRRGVDGDRHPETLRALRQLGVLATSLGDYAQAMDYLEEALAGLLVIYDPGH
ncbi:MAG: serine/threonine-protein kinase, partial [Planctomycetota bacterium]|nr:serine/threonine-protein kinase [Planctomycetota bacterium]